MAHNEANLWAPNAHISQAFLQNIHASRRLETAREIDQRGKADFGVFCSD